MRYVVANGKLLLRWAMTRDTTCTASGGDPQDVFHRQAVACGYWHPPCGDRVDDDTHASLQSVCEDTAALPQFQPQDADGRVLPTGALQRAFFLPRLDAMMGHAMRVTQRRHAPQQLRQGLLAAVRQRSGIGWCTGTHVKRCIDVGG